MASHSEGKEAMKERREERTEGMKEAKKVNGRSRALLFRNKG
jgi:hypothetical protein